MWFDVLAELWCHSLHLHTYSSTTSTQIVHVFRIILSDVWCHNAGAIRVQHYLKVVATTTLLHQFIKSKLQYFSYLNGYYSEHSTWHEQCMQTIFLFMHYLTTTISLLHWTSIHQLVQRNECMWQQQRSSSQCNTCARASIYILLSHTGIDYLG